MRYLILCLLSTIALYGQGNCLVYPEDSDEKKACELCHKAVTLKQGSRESQLLFDEAIAISPSFAYSYYQKSVPYFKRGFLLEGLYNLNQAVSLEALNYLCYRAYWYWQYKNYKLCIRDLERFYALPNAYSEYTPGGEKSMQVILALAYAKNKQLVKGIHTLERYIEQVETSDFIGTTDYLSLAILYIKNEQYEKGITTLKKQLSINKDIPDTFYYLAIANKNLNNYAAAALYFEKANTLIKEPYHAKNINGGYPIYISDIEKEIQNFN